MKQYLFVFTLLIVTVLPVLTYGQAPVYKPLVGIPGVDPAASFDTYINTLYALSISIAALLAVVKIVIAGVKYMMTDVVTSKGEAKKDILGALTGLIVVLSAVLILTIINPDITEVDLSFAKPGAPTFTTPTTPPSTVNPTTSTPTTDTLVSNDPAKIKIFTDNCEKSGYKSQTFYDADNNLTIVCYKDIAEYDTTRVSICTRLTSSQGCFQNQIDAAKAACKGTFTIDPDFPSAGICKTPK
jgi:hypothetical protein